MNLGVVVSNVFQITNFKNQKSKRYGGFPPVVGEVGGSSVFVSRYSVDGDEIGEIRLRVELDEDLERDIYGLGGDLSVVSNMGEGGGTGDLSPVTGNSPKPGITSVPKSSVKGRGGGRSTMASKSSFRNSSPAYSPSISAGPNNTVPFLKNLSFLCQPDTRSISG